MQYLASGEVPGPLGSGVAMIVPYQAFPAADGWVMIAAPSDAMFARLAAALGAPDLARDPRFADNPSRVRHRGPLVEALAALTRQRKREELVEAVRRAGVPCAPVLTVDRVLEEPQAPPHPRLPDYRSIALPVQWDGRRPEVRRVPPRLGEHTEDVLTWLGYTRDDVRSLRAQGVVG